MQFSSRTDWNFNPNDLTIVAGVLRKSGVPLIDLTVSNPTQCEFQYLNSSILKSFEDPKNLRYEPEARGLLSARKAICAYYERKGIGVLPEQIFITANTSEAYSFIFRLLFEPQDILVAPKPSYPLLSYLAQINDVLLETYPLIYAPSAPPSQSVNEKSAGYSWQADLSQLYKPLLVQPKALLIVNPNNPTGNFIHEDEIAEIRILCKRHGMALISDEVFFDYALDSKRKDRVSTATDAGVLSFTLGGISKVLGLPQMKLSWIVVTGPKTVRDQALQRLEVLADSFLSANTPVQNALPHWFEKQAEIQKEILNRLQSNYEFLNRTFAKSAIRVLDTEGAWNAIVQLPSDWSDEEWALRLLREQSVLVHPGYLFDFTDEGSFLILSLLVPEKTFQEGINKIAQQITASKA
jgi:alanine-synthesizing transaminase